MTTVSLFLTMMYGQANYLTVVQSMPFNGHQITPTIRGVSYTYDEHGTYWKLTETSAVRIARSERVNTLTGLAASESYLFSTGNKEMRCYERRTMKLISKAPIQGLAIIRAANDYGFAVRSLHTQSTLFFRTRDSKLITINDAVNPILDSYSMYFQDTKTKKLCVLDVRTLARTATRIEGFPLVIIGDAVILRGGPVLDKKTLRTRFDLQLVPPAPGGSWTIAGGKLWSYKGGRAGYLEVATPTGIISKISAPSTNSPAVFPLDKDRVLCAVIREGDVMELYVAKFGDKAVKMIGRVRGTFFGHSAKVVGRSLWVVDPESLRRYVIPKV
jgi:hypothetical protein